MRRRRNRKILDSILLEELLVEASNSISASTMRQAVQEALKSTGQFDFPESSNSRQKSRGIRINPSSALDEKTKDEITRALKDAAATVGLKLGELALPKSTPAGRKKPVSGTFYSWPIANIREWLQKSRGPQIKTGAYWIQKVLGDRDLPSIHKEMRTSSKTLDDEFIVVNARSLQNKLFTGQGLGELAEYATAAAINGESGAVDALNPSGGFYDAVEGAILNNSWKKADDNLKASFAEAYTKMRDKASANIGKIAGQGFDFGAAQVEGGGSSYDVVTTTALVHVKYDDPSRLSGLQQKTEDPSSGKVSKAKKSTPDEEVAFGASDRYWKNQRAAFKEAINKAGVRKDKELLGEWGFYEVLLNGGPYTKIQQSTDPAIEAWKASVTPGEIADKLIQDIKREFGESQRKDAQGNQMPQFYFSYFPLGEDDYRLKIESVEFGDTRGPADIAGSITLYSPDGQQTTVRNLEIVMNPSYKGREGGTQIGKVYNAVSGNRTIFEIEFRAENSAKPIQVHRGDGFSVEPESTDTAMATVLVNEIRKMIRRIIREENERSNISFCDRVTESLLLEELTKSDKKEIEKMIKKRIEADRSEQKKIIQKEMAVELKKNLGKDFFGNPNKLHKAIQEIANEELMKEFSKGKARDEVVDITKKVLKKFYREISFSSNIVIDRVKL